MFWKSKEFRTRLVISIGIIIIIGIGTFTPNAIMLRLIYVGAVALVLYEIDTALNISDQPLDQQYALDWVFSPLLLFILYAISIMGFAHLEVKTILLLLFVSYGSDVIGYLVGNLCGGRFIKTRPFPVTSPKKTWEGLIASIILPIPVVVITNAVWPSLNYAYTTTDCALVAGPIVAVMGDYVASRFKRAYALKDSCDYANNSRFVRLFESLLGGPNGHGGYLDRTDSLCFATAYAVIIYALAAVI